MLFSYEGEKPQIEEDVFVANNAVVLGKVKFLAQSSLWYGAVVRGDVGRIVIGKRTNVQDLSVVHVTSDQCDTAVGDDVTIGHRVVLHGCTVGDRVLVGMGSIVMDGADIGHDCMIGAGALVTPGTRIPPGTLALGAPARVVRDLKDSERQGILQSAALYVQLAQEHRLVMVSEAG